MDTASNTLPGDQLPPPDPLGTPVTEKKHLLFAIGLVVVIWALLYIPHVRTSPGWYGDETLIHSCSRDLAKGQPTHFALWNTYWHPHYPYQPGYTFINGLFANAAGGDIAGSRFFNTLLALASALAIVLLGRQFLSLRCALFGALMFLCYSQSVIHFRMSYAHNAVAFGIVLMTLFLIRAPGFRNDLAAGCGLAIAAASHPLFIHPAIVAGLVRWRQYRSWIPLFAPAGIVVLASLGFAYFNFGHWLWEDLAQLKFTFTSRGSEDGGGFKAFSNFFIFITQDWFHVGAALGILACLNRRLYPISIATALIMFLLVKNRQNLIIFYYQAAILLPLLGLAWAGFLKFIEIRLEKLSIPSINWITWLFWVLPLASLVQMAPLSLSGTLKPRNFYWVTQSPEEVEEAAAWLNARTTADDTVGGNANIAWLLKAKTIPYLQMITWYGIPTQGYENGNKRERFRFDASLEKVKFAIIGDIDQRWTFGEPNVKQIADKIVEEKWPIVWQSTNYLIAANPRYLPGKEETPETGAQSPQSAPPTAVPEATPQLSP